MTLETGRGEASGDKVVLIVSPHFPPSTLAGVHRARHLAKHLPAHGWRPVVIRVDERHYTETPDPDLSLLVPASVEQVRAKAVAAKVARLAGIGDIGIRAYAGLGQAIEDACRRFGAKAVLITGSPFYPMLLSGGLTRKLKVPVVLDFQDPWVSEHGTMSSIWSKAGIAHRLAVLLEPRAVKPAAFITSVSETQNAQMLRRYAWLDPSRMRAIPIGGDPEDFLALRARSPDRHIHKLNPGLINLSYVGTFLPRSGPLFRQIFKSFRQLLVRQPGLASRLRLNFVGTSNQPAAYVGCGPVSRIALEEGVEQFVSETPQRVPFLEALSILATSNGLIMIGSDEPHYTASKIYPGLMSGRPFLSLYHALSSSHAILNEAGGGSCFAFTSLQELEGMTEAIAHGLQNLVETPDALGTASPASFAAYTASAIAKEFADVLDCAIDSFSMQTR